jgi:hypothetical protein
MVFYPAVDIAPVVARALAAGRSVDLSRAAEGILQIALAADAAGTAEARALAWLGRLIFVGADAGLEELVASLSGTGRAQAYLVRHKRLLALRRRQEKFEGLVDELKRAKAAEFNEYRALFFPDTEETVPTDAIPDYVRDRFRERDPIPFGFPVEIMEWTGIFEGDLRVELDLHGRNAFDLESVIRRSLVDFGAEAREDVVNERRLWRIVGRWLEGSGADASMAFVVELARWNAMQHVKTTRVLRDVIVPTYDPVDRKEVLRWCRERATAIGREIQETVEDWPHQTAQ